MENYRIQMKAIEYMYKCKILDTNKTFTMQMEKIKYNIVWHAIQLAYVSGYYLSLSCFYDILLLNLAI